MQPANSHSLSASRAILVAGASALVAAFGLGAVFLNFTDQVRQHAATQHALADILSPAPAQAEWARLLREEPPEQWVQHLHQGHIRGLLGSYAHGTWSLPKSPQPHDLATFFHTEMLRATTQHDETRLRYLAHAWTQAIRAADNRTMPHLAHFLLRLRIMEQGLAGIVGADLAWMSPQGRQEIVHALDFVRSEAMAMSVTMQQVAHQRDIAILDYASRWTDSPDMLAILCLDRHYALACSLAAFGYPHTEPAPWFDHLLPWRVAPLAHPVPLRSHLTEIVDLASRFDP